ncbi:hypothetical protein ACIBAG_27550 [Streptomyces sp. NPDC051243]|uniref:hypothetical protein n=1 Tax=Streptomyces sp. NPDC051243 TaxID=3365646 RepID=UPI00378F18DF
MMVTTACLLVLSVVAAARPGMATGLVAPAGPGGCPPMAIPDAASAIALTAVPCLLLAAVMTPAFLTVGALARPAPPPRRTPS